MNINVLRILAAIMFLGALFFGWYGYQLSKPAKLEEVEMPHPVMQAQIVSAQKILAKQVITASDLETRMTAQQLSSGFSNISEIVGRVALTEIEAGEPILEAHLKQLGPAASQLLAGERAIAVKIDEVSGVGGYIKPGDHVDVLFFANDDQSHSRSSVSQVVLRDLRVLSFGDLIQENKKPVDSSGSPITNTKNEVNALPNSSVKPDTSTRSAVLAVPEEQATTLMLAANMGQLRLALRGERLLSNDPDPTVSKTSAQSPASRSENHFLRSDALLKPDGLKLEQPITPPLPPTITSPKAKPKSSSSQVIIHYGDATETVNVRDFK